MSKEQWTMQEWMEPCRSMIGNTDGNPIEELMNNHETNMQRSSGCVCC